MKKVTRTPDLFYCRGPNNLLQQTGPPSRFSEVFAQQAARLLSFVVSGKVCYGRMAQAQSTMSEMCLPVVGGDYVLMAREDTRRLPDRRHYLSGSLHGVQCEVRAS